MKKYKHYSFDLWLTLIRSNPAFKTERAKYFFERFNYNGKSLDQVERVFRQVDTLINSINEKTGKNIAAEELYLLIISAINDLDDVIEEVDADRLYEDMEELFLAYPPVLYEAQTLEVLHSLKTSTQAGFCLLSNTAFIKGKTLRKVFPGLGFTGLFDFYLFSDESGVSKPNKQFFELMLDTVAVNIGITAKEDILHVGDNPRADKEGAITVGIDCFLINSNQQRISDLL